MRINIFNLTTGTIKHYDSFPEAKDSKAKPVRKDVRKGKDKKKRDGRTSSIKKMDRNKRKYTKICSPKAQEGHSKAKEGKATIHTKTHKEKRFHILKMDKDKRRVQVRSSGTKVPRGNPVRTLDKKRKEKRKMVRD